MRLEITIFAHCILIVDLLVEERQQYQCNLHIIEKVHLMGYYSVVDNTGLY